MMPPSAEQCIGQGLCTEMPGRLILGNPVSGNQGSRKSSLRTLAYLYGTGAYRAHHQVLRAEAPTPSNLAGRISSPPRHRGDLPIKGTISLPSKRPHHTHTTGTGSGRPYDGFSKPREGLYYPSLAGPSKPGDLHTSPC